MSASNWVTLEVAKIEHETEKAFLVRLEDGEQLWLPFSQCADAEDYETGDTDVEISVSEWWAKQNNLEIE